MQDSFIVKKLQGNIKKYERLRINYSEFLKYKKRLENEIQSSENKEIVRIQSDLRFDYEFVKDLIEDTKNIDIDIFKEDN